MNVTNKDKKKCEESESEESEDKKKKEDQEDKDDNEKEEKPSVEDKKNVVDVLALERKRLQEIDAIAHLVPDKKLLNEAKYGGSPMSAQELAYKVMLQSKSEGKAFLNAWESDQEESGANLVGAVPASDPQATKEMKAKVQEKHDFNDAVERVISERGKKNDSKR